MSKRGSNIDFMIIVWFCPFFLEGGVSVCARGIKTQRYLAADVEIWFIAWTIPKLLGLLFEM